MSASTLDVTIDSDKDNPNRLELNEMWKRVRNALISSEWNYRTIRGISKETGLSQDEVKKVLLAYQKHIHKSSINDRTGRQLYSLRERGAPMYELYEAARTFITKS